MVEAAVDIAAAVVEQRKVPNRSSGNLPLFDCLDLAGPAGAFQMAPVPKAVVAVVGTASAAGIVVAEQEDKKQQVGAVQTIEEVAEMVADRTKIPSILARYKPRKTTNVVQMVEWHSLIPKNNWSKAVGPEVVREEADHKKDPLHRGRGHSRSSMQTDCSMNN